VVIFGNVYICLLSSFKFQPLRFEQLFVIVIISFFGKIWVVRQLRWGEGFQIPSWFSIAWASAFANCFVSPGFTRYLFPSPFFTISRFRYSGL